MICYEVVGNTITHGLRLYDMETVVTKNVCESILLKNIDFGFQGRLEYSSSVKRLAFIKSITHIIITPVLHWNCIRFMGMDKCKDYITYKVIKDRFVALKPNGII